MGQLTRGGKRKCLRSLSLLQAQRASDELRDLWSQIATTNRLKARNYAR